MTNVTGSGGQAYYYSVGTGAHTVTTLVSLVGETQVTVTSTASVAQAEALSTLIFQTFATDGHVDHDDDRARPDRAATRHSPRPGPREVRRRSAHRRDRNRTGSAARDVLDLLLAGGDEGHHVAQFGADLLDLVLLAGLLEPLVVRPAVGVLGDPLGGEPAVLDLVEDARASRP